MALEVKRELEDDDYIICFNTYYNNATLEECKKSFLDMVKDGIIIGDFDSFTWKHSNGVKTGSVNFAFDVSSYKLYLQRYTKMEPVDVLKALKCYFVFLSGQYIFQSIIVERIDTIKQFIRKSGEKRIVVSRKKLTYIEEFFCFLGINLEDINQITKHILIKKEKKGKSRDLKHPIHYLIIADKINQMFKDSLSDELFIKLFPIFFWVNITMIIPLRPTEMIVTPLDCLISKNEHYYIKLRRTTLKKRKIKVYHDVEKDYEVEELPINENINNIIKKYIELTSDQDRRFLFKYSKNMTNKMVSLQAFNKLIKVFEDTYVFNDDNYNNFIKFATGIDEFEYVNAGDSRPIAMVNVYFQNYSPDICRQLARHENVSTSEGYYSNIDKILFSSSIIRFRDGIFEKKNNINEAKKIKVYDDVVEKCKSRRRKVDPEDVTDCKENDHVSDCVGCRLWIPNKKDLDIFIEKYEKKMRESMSAFVEAFGKNKDYDSYLLDLQNAIVNYNIGCEYRVYEEWEKWQKR